MQRRYLQGIIYLSLCLLVFASCSKFRKIQKSDDIEYKYESAVKYYNENDYYRASLLFEEVIPLLRGRPEAEDAQFKFAYCYFQQKQYILSAHYFRTFYTTYSRSTKAEEGEYMYAFSLYKQSPNANLDQTSTMEAITAMQSFLNKHPYSEFAKDADKLIGDMQEKLETKAFDNAVQYHKLMRYKAALIAFENFRQGYPDSDYMEQVHFLEVESQFLLAEASIQSKKLERYKETLTRYESFVDTYPESEYLSRAQNYYEQSRDKVAQLSKNL